MILRCNGRSLNDTARRWRWRKDTSCTVRKRRKRRMRRYADYCGPLVSWVENDRANERLARIYLRNMPQAWAYDMPNKACALASRNVRVAGPIQAAARQIRGEESTSAQGKHRRITC